MENQLNWWEEKRSAYLYGIIASSESNVLHKKLFLDLKAAAEKQALSWEKKLQADGESIPTEFKPDLRTRIVASIIPILGVERLQKVLSAMKIRGMAVFTQYHAEHKHTSLSASSNIRAAVFGVNDGLISNMSLILGVAGANASDHFILIAGIAGLLAGALSMGAGEYVSVRSQREVFEYQIAIEREELREYPEEEKEELSLIYQARGIPKEDADQLASLMIKHPETGLNALAREELGLNPEDLVSPTGAMLASFISFAIGAALPLIPYLLGLAQWKMSISMGITTISLFLIGASLSLFTNKNPIFLGVRMLLIGIIAGAATFGIGKLLGIAAV
jgi:VIT1/CCC1 family predicted Fe2+/Mn2+ transporter